jgi:hypothetical protein
MSTLSRRAAQAATALRQQKPNSLIFKRPLTGYSVFLKATANHPTLTGLPLRERGRQVALMWKTLSPKEKGEFVKKGRSMIVVYRKRLPTEPLTPDALASIEAAIKTSGRREQRKSRSPTPFNLFVKRHYDTVRHLPFDQRLGHLSTLWCATRKRAAPRSSPLHAANGEKNQLYSIPS